MIWPKEIEMESGMFKKKKTDNVIEVLLGKEPGTLEWIDGNDQ